MLFRDYQYMYRCLWVQVVKRDNLVILVRDIRWNFVVCNHAEYTVAHGKISPFSPS